MIVVKTVEPENLLLIHYSGRVEPDEMKGGLEEMRAGLARLESGFRLLADLTDLESMDVACAPFIEKAMDLCNEKGASLVLRVIPDPHRDIGLQIMSIFHYTKDVRILTCQTLVEATEILRGQS
jgi:anti-anti-sigma regulatory factor